MSMMKRYCEEISTDMGLSGEITDEVMVEAQARLDAGLTATCKQEPPGHAARRLVIVDRLVQLIEDFWEYTEPNRIYRQGQPLSGSDEAYNTTQLRKYDDIMQRAQFVMDAKRKRTPATDAAVDAETQAVQVRLDAAPCPIEHAVRNWGDEGYDISDALAGLTTLKQSRDALLARLQDVELSLAIYMTQETKSWFKELRARIHETIVQAETQSQSPEPKPPIRRSDTEQHDERSTGNGGAASSESCDQEPEDGLREPRDGDSDA